MFKSNIEFNGSTPIDWRTASRATVETEFLNILEAQHCCMCSPAECNGSIPQGSCPEHEDW